MNLDCFRLVKEYNKEFLLFSMMFCELTREELGKQSETSITDSSEKKKEYGVQNECVLLTMIVEEE